MSPGNVYVASRASIRERVDTWRELRDDYNWPIISSWIDFPEREDNRMDELWGNITIEIAACSGLILWAELEDFPLRGALIEVGMALGMGKRVAVYTNAALDKNGRPFGSWTKHPQVRRCFSFNQSLSWALHGIDPFPSLGNAKQIPASEIVGLPWDATAIQGGAIGEKKDG